MEKEKEITRKCVTALEEALATAEADPTAAAGKGDPYVVRLGVERQVERQIDEENYLHRVSSCMVLSSYLQLTKNKIGVSQPRKLWSRTRVDCRWRNPKSIQCPSQYPKA